MENDGGESNITEVSIRTALDACAVQSFSEPSDIATTLSVLRDARRFLPPSKATVHDLCGDLFSAVARLSKRTSSSKVKETAVSLFSSWREAAMASPGARSALIAIRSNRKRHKLHTKQNKVSSYTKKTSMAKKRCRIETLVPEKRQRISKEVSSVQPFSPLVYRNTSDTTTKLPHFSPFMKSNTRVKCPICRSVPGRQKTFLLGSALRMHFNAMHPSVLSNPKMFDKISKEIKSAIDSNTEKKKILSSPNSNDNLTNDDKRILSDGLKAAKTGDLEMLQHLYTIGLWKVGDSDYRGSCALHWAAGGGHIDIVKWLIEVQKRSPNTCAPKGNGRDDGKTAIHWAARHGRKNVVLYLMERGVKPDVAAKDGTTPIHLAAYGGHLSVFQLLINHSDFDHQNGILSDISVSMIKWKNNFQCNAVHFAAMGGSINIVEWIWSNLSSVKNKNNSDKIIHKNNMDEIFASVQSQGHTPLHKAAAKGFLDVALFLSNKVSKEKIYLKDSSGYTATDLARIMGHNEVEKMLLLQQ